MIKGIIKNKRARKVFYWVLGVFLFQFLLINISSALYAYRLTYFYDASPASKPPASKNLFTKTWHMFRGPTFFKQQVKVEPDCLYQSLTLFTHDSIPISGWYIPADSSVGTVLIFHGLAENRVAMLDIANAFQKWKYNVMMVDFRAHGNSGGHVCTYGVKESEEVKLAYEYVSGKGEKNIIMYGLSMGAVAAAKSIYDYGLAPSKLILDFPFASLRDHFQGRARILGFPSEPFGTLEVFWTGVERGFNGFRHSTARYVEKIKCPVLLEYGLKDPLVLRNETNEIYDHIKSAQKKLVEYEDAGHSVFVNVEFMIWSSEVLDFLTTTQK